MASDKYAGRALALFRTYVQQEQASSADTAAPPVGGRGEMAITTPHPYYLVSGDAVLSGRLAGAEKLAGYQSIVFQGERAVEAPIAEPEGEEEVSYLGSWSPDTAAALDDAIRVAEEHGRDAHDFAVVTIPEVGFTGVWLRDRHEIVPMATPIARSALDPRRIYTEDEVIEHLREPLSERLDTPTGGGAEGELEEPPEA